jgi:hypothetical protein
MGNRSKQTSQYARAILCSTVMCFAGERTLADEPAFDVAALDRAIEYCVANAEAKGLSRDMPSPEGWTKVEDEAGLTDMLVQEYANRAITNVVYKIVIGDNSGRKVPPDLLSRTLSRLADVPPDRVQEFMASMRNQKRVHKNGSIFLLDEFYLDSNDLLAEPHWDCKFYAPDEVSSYILSRWDGTLTDGRYARGMERDDQVFGKIKASITLSILDFSAIAARFPDSGDVEFEVNGYKLLPVVFGLGLTEPSQADSQ